MSDTVNVSAVKSHCLLCKVTLVHFAKCPNVYMRNEVICPHMAGNSYSLRVLDWQWNNNQPINQNEHCLLKVFKGFATNYEIHVGCTLSKGNVCFVGWRQMY